MSQIQLEQHSQAQNDQKRALLELDELTVAFRKVSGLFGGTSSVFTAVDHVSFKLFESEFVSLVGESGSGKSTIARCITVLTRPSSGKILYKGADINEMKGSMLVDFRQDVQIIYQDPFESLNPRQDVFSTVSAPLRHLSGLKGSTALVNEVSNLLSEVGLEPRMVLHKYPHQLSGGERQRVNIARALAPKPKLLIADEPVTMLDATQRFNVLSLLMKLKTSRNLTVLMITHDLPSAQLVSDRTLVIYLGKIVETGPTRDVMRTPHHPYVELIMSSIPRPAWLAEQGGVRQLSIEESMSVRQGCSFYPRCKYSLPLCKTVAPILEEKSPQHLASCHNPRNFGPDKIN